VFNGAQIVGVYGGKLTKASDGTEMLMAALPRTDSAAATRLTLNIHFGSKSGNVRPKP
jgi:hypothetical protein